jgi:glycosyltransferase involved in cell wall biosynthesis
MRIGFDAKRVFFNTTGLGNYGRDVLRVLHRHRPEHELVAYTPGKGRVAFDLGERFQVRRPRGLLGRAFPSAWRTAGVAADAARDGIEVFHGLTAELPLGLARHGIRSIVTIHDLIFERFPELYGAIDRRIYGWKARRAAHDADLVVADTEQTRRDVVDFYGVAQDKVQVVPLGCHGIFREPRSREALDDVARRLALPRTFLLAVGTIEKRKNLEVVVRALPGLPGISLVAVGRATPYLAELEALAREVGVEDRVRFLSGTGLADLAALYALATLVVYPSIFEGFGLPIVEALFSGTPVVTSTGGCFAEVGGPSSVYVDPRDPEAWRETLRALLADPDRRKAISSGGLAWAERYTDAAIAAALDAAYRRVRP